MALDIVRGQSKAITFSIKVNGTAIDISGYTGEFKARAPGAGSTLQLDLGDARFVNTSSTVKTLTLTKGLNR